MVRQRSPQYTHSRSLTPRGQRKHNVSPPSLVLYIVLPTEGERRTRGQTYTLRDHIRTYANPDPCACIRTRGRRAHCDRVKGEIRNLIAIGVIDDLPAKTYLPASRATVSAHVVTTPEHALFASSSGPVQAATCAQGMRCVANLVVSWRGKASTQGYVSPA